MINKYIIIIGIATFVFSIMYISYLQDKNKIQEQKIKIENQKIIIQKQKEESKVKSFEAVQEQKHKQFIKELKKIKEQNDSKEINDSIGTHTISF
jgi:hypothetical protein